MRPHIVRKGETLAKIATRLSFDPDTVWNDDKNADLRELRPNPNILHPADILWVPVKPVPRILPLTPGQVNTFVGTVPKTPVSVTFMKGGKPLANAQCVVRELPPPNEFTTNDSGTLALSVPTLTEFVTVDFTDLGITHRLDVGHLNPIDTRSGLIQRLHNLGYLSLRDPGSDDFDPEHLSTALFAFQAAQGLPLTGEADEATVAQLSTAHRS